MGKLLNDKEAAEYLGILSQTLRLWRSNLNRTGVYIGPPFIKLGTKLIRYDIADLDAWIQEQKTPTTRKETDHE